MIKGFNIYYLEHNVTEQPFYVGMTSLSLEARFNAHQYKQDAKQIHLIETVDWHKAPLLELYWIDQFKAWGFELRNKRRANPYQVWQVDEMKKRVADPLWFRKKRVWGHRRMNNNDFCKRHFGCSLQNFPKHLLQTA